MTSPNTESDKSIDRIDEIFAPLVDSPSLTLTTTYWNEARDILYSLLMDVIGSAELEEVSGEQIPEAWIRNQFRLHQIVKLNKLFNKEETSK